MLTLWGLYRIGRRIPGFPAWIELPEYINCPLCTDTFPVISNYDPLNCVPHMRIWSFKRARYSFRNFVLKRKHVAPSLEYFPALPSALFIHWKYTIVWNHSHAISGWGYGLGQEQGACHNILFFYKEKRILRELTPIFMWARMSYPTKLTLN